MSLKTTFQDDLKSAMKSGDEEAKNYLRLLLAAIQSKEVSLRGKGEERELSDEEIIQVLQTEAKKRKESIEKYTEGGRTDLADIEKKELAAIEKYLPELMSKEETETAVKAILEKNSAAQFGEAMKAVMAELKGKADAKLISQIVKEHFGS